MRLLHKAVLEPRSQTPSIPNLWPALTQRGINLRVGEVSLLCGRPSSGKSMVALNIAYRAKVPTLYVSCDSHKATQAMRLLALKTGNDQSVIEQWMSDNTKYVSDLLRSEDYLRWNFLSSPSIQDIEDLVEAHAEMWTDAPVLLIVDNLVDTLRSPDDQWGKSFLLDIKELCRDWQMAGLVLHHMSLSRPHPSGSVPDMESIQGKTAETPALILSVAQQDGWLGLGSVKNRYGHMDAAGRTVDWFQYEPERAYIGEVGDGEFVEN